jgi:hypothetical protein
VKKKYDSMSAQISVDRSQTRTERVEIDPAVPAHVQLMSADKRLEAKIVAKSTLTMLAYVDDDGAFEAHLDLKVDENFVSVVLNKAMNSVDMVEAISKVLPDGYEPATRESSASEVLIVTILRPQEAQQTAPEISFLSTDPHQLFRWVAKNKLRIEGRSAMGLSLRSVIDVYIEGYRVKLPLGRGDFPLTTANRLRDALPNEYSALIELPMVPGGDVTLTILRRR